MGTDFLYHNGIGLSKAKQIGAIGNESCQLTFFMFSFKISFSLVTVNANSTSNRCQAV